MTEVLLPAAPNWYGAHILSGYSGKMVFASKEALTQVELSTRRTEVIPCPCRVIACCASDSFICATGSDKIVRAFTTDGRPYKTHQVHKVDASAIQCRGELVLSGDNRGLLVLWDLHLGRTREFRPSLTKNHPIVALALGPETTFALGLGSGLVATMNWESDDVNSLVRHTGTIKSLHWRGDKLACSSNALIQVWNTADWSVVGTKDVKEKWVCVHIVDDGILYTKDRGEIMHWDFTSKAPKKLHHDQSRCIFGLFSWNTQFAAISLDRSAAFYIDGKLKWRLMGIGGHCGHVSTAHLSTAVASGEGNVRIVDLMHLEHRDHAQVLWKNLMSPCTALVAHASKQSFWGYGLSDGSFGVICRPDKGAAFAHPMQTQSQHTGRVKSLCWASSTADPTAFKKDIVVPGDMLISVGAEVLATQFGKASVEVPTDGEPLCVCAASPAGGWYIALKRPNDACVITRMNGLAVQETVPAPFLVSVLACGGDGVLVLGSEDGELCIRSGQASNDGKEVSKDSKEAAPWKAHRHRVHGVDILYDTSGEKKLVSASSDDVKVWRNSQLIATLPGVTACWDRTVEPPAVIYGGVEQVVSRWSFNDSKDADGGDGSVVVFPERHEEQVRKKDKDNKPPKDTLVRKAFTLVHQSKANELLEMALEVAEGQHSTFGGAVFGRTQKQAECWLEHEKGGFYGRLLSYWLDPDGDVPVDVTEKVSEQWLWAALKPTYCPQGTSIHQYVCFLLAHNLLADAIRAYQQGGFLLEAILLARIRLPDNHPVIQTLYTALSSSLPQGAQACCWAAVGDMRKSAECALKLVDAENDIKRRQLKAKLSLYAAKDSSIDDPILRPVVEYVCCLWESDDAVMVRALFEEKEFQEVSALDALRRCFCLKQPVSPLPHCDVLDAYPKAKAHWEHWASKAVGPQ
eukprot:GEMP01004242.1.p1 GENE.GEMP01004242.1~~GEMP01004242.1.p1  ORF type:complete len:931 (+),score=220.49 GEMP01004242.1:49-2793(+)